MTEIAEAPVAAKSGELKRISHWIGGKPVCRHVGPERPVYNPAKGQQAAEVDFASVEEIDLAVQAAGGGFPAARDVAVAPHRVVLQDPRARPHALRRHREEAAHGRARRCSPTRWARSPAGSR